MRIGSLFSGIAGLELGIIAENPGAEVAWQAECDPYALSVLAHHFPTVRRYPDVRGIDATAARVDVVCGGFPCQPHSLAGKRRGTKDARWLWPEFARVVAELRPAAVFIENVPGLRTSGLRNVLADLAGLGFDAVWDCFSAAEVGAPHIRKRLFILAYADGFDGRIQPGRRNGARGADSAVASNDGADRDLADTDGERQLQQGGSVGEKRGRLGDGSEELANAACDGRITWGAGDAEEITGGREPDRSRVGAYDVANADGAGWLGARYSIDGVRDQAAGDAAQSDDGGRDSALGLTSRWPAEPDVGRTLDGFSAWLDKDGRVTEAHKLYLAYGNEGQASFAEGVCELLRRYEQEALQRETRGSSGVSSASVLLSFLRKLPAGRKAWDASLEGTETSEGGVRVLRTISPTPRTSRRRKSPKWPNWESPDALRVLSQLLARAAESSWSAYRRSNASDDLGWEDGFSRVADGVSDRAHRLRLLGNSVVQQQAALAWRTLAARAANLRGAVEAEA